jgi:hypothetical protein
MAIACLRLVTFLPLPLFSLPSFIAFISVSTLLPAASLYFRVLFLLLDFLLAFLVAIGRLPLHQMNDFFALVAFGAAIYDRQTSGTNMDWLEADFAGNHFGNSCVYPLYAMRGHNELGHHGYSRSDRARQAYYGGAGEKSPPAVLQRNYAKQSFGPLLR